jgi:hypothetical protein
MTEKSTFALFCLLSASVSDPHQFYADPDPDPAFLLNADADPEFKVF